MNPKVHVIHVGTMDNRGSQALILSDISIIREITGGDVDLSVSTNDVEGVKKLNADLKSVVSPFVDIPFQKVDALGKKYNFQRTSLKYKMFALGFLFFMGIQCLSSIFSVILLKLGVRPFYRYENLKNLKECKLVVSYSDENFKETASSLPLNVFWVISWWSMLISRTWEILIAKSLSKPVVMFPNSIGPFRTYVGESLTKLALNSCDFVLARESISYEIAKSLQINSNIILTADTALLFKSSAPFPEDDFSELNIGVAPGIYGKSLSKDEVHQFIFSHAQALDDCIKKYNTKIFFLPHFVNGFSNDDLQMSKSIYSQMINKENAEIIYEPNVEKYKVILQKMDVLISSKLHPAILASSSFIPVVCIIYDHKQTGFFQRLGMINCTLDVRMVSYEKLSQKIDYVWYNKKELSLSLKRQIPHLQNDIRQAIRKAIIPFL
ncbi:MAG: polysaccharide pyruvyl transferase family protein [Clostridiales bacterium]|nr:polysaccharide pyruvyl transferase family protein [Clostridiales bacterium]